MKDATDFTYILKQYLKAGNIDEIYSGEHQDLLENFDYEISGARLLGRHMAEILENEPKKMVSNLLIQEITNQNCHRLIEDMIKEDPSNEFDKMLELLKSLSLGFSER